MERPTTGVKGALRRRHGLLVLAALSAAGLGCGDFGGESGGAAAGFLLGASFGPSSSPAGVADISAFQASVYPLTRQYCEECHAGSGPGSPHISHPDPTTAYHAVVDQGKVSLSNPGSSRLVQRLVADFHHCWSNCVADGAVMQAAIEQWAAALEEPEGEDVDGLASRSSSMNEGIADTSSERYSQHVIALFKFEEGTGSVAHDTSGVSPAMDLQISGDEISWMPNHGLDIASGRAMASAETSRKLYERIAAPYTGTSQYSVEVWMRAATIDQDGPARVASYSQGGGERNFTVGQVQYQLDFRNRSLAFGIDENGMPSLETAEEDRDIEANLQHIVVTYDQYRGRRVYVNGEYTGDRDRAGPGRLWNWDPSHRFVIGNETGGGRQWTGRIRLVAVYNQALSESQIQQNFDAGVGKRFLLRFDVGEWVGEGAAIEFQVSEFDAYSYLFCEPTLTNPNGGSVPVGDIRIAVNGVIPVSGQAFRTLDVAASDTKTLLSRQCSVIPKGTGPDSDRFTLVFERLGGFQDVVVEVNPPPPPVGGSSGMRPDEGLRDFARANETMAALTGVDPLTSSVAATYDEIEQALPGSYDVRAFVTSQQVSLAKLSLEYCDTLVETPTLRDAFFGPSFEFDQPPAVAFSDPTKRDLIFDPLMDRMIRVDLATQPARVDVRPILDQLVDDLLLQCATSTCDAVRTRTVVKGACSAVLASAAITIH